jgi:surface protein
MVKINSEGEYLLKSGAGSIFRKYTQNSRVPPTATVVGDTPPPPFGYKFPNTIPIGTPIGTPAVNTSFLTGKLVTAVDMWVNPTTQEDAVKKYGDIQYWDVSNVTDMEGLFSGGRNNTLKIALQNFNGNIRNWDVSKVTNMKAMFADSMVFNQPIGNWDVSKVTNMEAMFGGTKKFNQQLPWDTGNVTDMASTFEGAIAFNQPLDWNTSKVTDMASTFKGAIFFNQPLNWNTSKVTDMASTFEGAIAFNQPLNWNTINVTDMKKMFHGAIAFDQRLGSWDVGLVTSMNDMFNSATAFMANDANYTHATNGISKWKPAVITAPIVNMFKGIATTTASKWVALHNAASINPLIDSNTGTVNTPAATTGTNPRMFNN